MGIFRISEEQTMRRRVQAFVTTLVFGAILWFIWQRTFIVLYVNIPWWVAVVLLIVLFLVVEHLVSRVFR